MTMFLGQSTVLPVPPYQQSVSITKKISNYIFKFEDKIGQGNFSKVYRGVHQLTNEQVAIKIIELSSVKSAKLQQLLFSQIEVIQSLNHPNILKCYEVLKSENNCYIITELCNGGDLQSLLKKEKCLNQISAAPYIKDIYRGLLYLGERGIVHRDLKIANIFLHNGVCKIADFGFAKYTNNQNFFDLDIGSPLYMSPEGMIEHIYGMKTDIWSFGVILFELLHGKTPFSYCTSEYELKRAVVTPISYHSLRPDISAEVKQLILKCLVVDSTHRPDAIYLKDDPFLYRLLNDVNEGVQYMVTPVQHMNQGLQLPSSNLGEQFRKLQPVSNSPNHLTGQGFYLQPVPIYTQQPSKSAPYINTQAIRQQSVQYLQVQQVPQQFSANSPTRASNKMSEFIKQTSVQGSINKQARLNEKQSTKNLDRSPSTNACHPRSYENIQTPTHSYADIITEMNYPKDQADTIKMTQQQTAQKNNKNLSSQNFDKASNSSWSFQNVNKKKVNKVMSHQNLNKVQNNLVLINTQHQRTKDSNYVNTSVNGSFNGRVQGSFQPTHTNITPQKVQHSNSSNKHVENSINQSLTGRSIVTGNTQKLNFKEDPTKSPKKFGQIIKGEKRTDAPIKSTIKLDKTNESDQKSMIERAKTKSYLKYDQLSIANTSQSPNKKRQSRHSYGEISVYNHSQNVNNSFNHPTTTRTPLPSFIQEKQRQKQELKRNLIITIIEFKQAVGILHFCRLYYRFIVMLKKVMMFPEVKKYDFLAKCFKNYDQHIEIYSRFMLTALSELIDNIKFKEIIYDGESYKKKKLKEDKLKEVTQEYFKKYMEETNRNRSSHHKIVPVYAKSTSISFIKDYNEHLWEVHDKEYNNVMQISRKTGEIGENFTKNFRNLCYLGIRINEANEILANCVHIKNYKILSDATMENWLVQEYYGEQVYFKLKNDHFRRINQVNALQNSQTNDTQTQNRSRTEYM